MRFKMECITASLHVTDAATLPMCNVYMMKSKDDSGREWKFVVCSSIGVHSFIDLRLLSAHIVDIWLPGTKRFLIQFQQTNKK